MFCIEQIYSQKQEIKKSTFISYLCPFYEFEHLHKQLKAEHQKAVHIVWAYRYYNKYLQIVENLSDDGEPKGSSGAPSLDALRGADLIDVAVFIVRYFGGIKLGVGGLVRAYSSSVNLAIANAELIKFEIKDECRFFVPFALISRFLHYFEKSNLSEISKDFTLDGCEFEFKFTQNEFFDFWNFSKQFLQSGFSILAMPLSAKNLF